MRFGKRYLQYFVEVVYDNSYRFKKGVVGKGTYVPKDSTRKVREGSIIFDMKADGVDGEPIEFRMVFESEDDAFRYLTLKNGAIKSAMYPDREGDVLEDKVEKKAKKEE